MASPALEVPTPEPAELDTQLYRHSKRPEWGAAVIAWERDGTRGYQFEDGQLRKIRKGFYKLLEPAEDLGERAEHIRTNLIRVVTAGGDASEPTVLEATCPFSDQVDLFKRLYPGGFQDPEWIQDHRRTDGTPLKRHRDAISKEAREALSADACKAALGSGKGVDLTDTIIDILTRTDLVPISHAKSLKGLTPEEKTRYAQNVATLLHGEAPYAERYKPYLRMLGEFLGERPSWRVGTVLSGLVHPQEHVVVRRSAFLRQAASIAPTARYTRRARVPSYRNFQRVAQGTRERLQASGLEPHDLLDVHDFIWVTLRKSALEHLSST